jgi:hypothetical protein
VVKVAENENFWVNARFFKKGGTKKVMFDPTASENPKNIYMNKL